MVLKAAFKVPSLRELIRTTFGKDNWSTKKPIEKWSYLYGIAKYFSFLIGFPIFKACQKTSFRSSVIFIILAIYALLAIYTVYFHTHRGDAGKSLSSTCLSALAYSNWPIVYLFTYSKNRDTVVTLIDFGGDYVYSKSKRDDASYNNVLMTHINGTVKSFFIKMLGIMMSYLICLAGPVHAYVKHGIKTSTTDVRIPFIEAGSENEFFFNLLLQCVIASFGIGGYIIIEVAMTMFSDIITIVPKIIEYKLTQLDSAVEEMEFTELQQILAINDIVKHSIDSDKYINTVNDVLYYRWLLTPASQAYSIAMSINCYYSLDFAAGYGLAMMSWIQLLFSCGLGESTSVGISPYESKWYALSLKQQRAIQLLLHRSQHPPRMTMGPFTNIDRELFKVVTNKIYTFVMFLRNFGQ